MPSGVNFAEMQRANITREMYANERKHVQRDLHYPPRPVTPPGWMTGTMWPRHAHWKRPTVPVTDPYAAAAALGVSRKPQVFGEPFQPQPLIRPASRSEAPQQTKVFPVLNPPKSHLDFRRPDPWFIANGRRASHQNGVLRDDYTVYREAVYKMWNVTGVKSPASFR